MSECDVTCTDVHITLEVVRHLEPEISRYRWRRGDHAKFRRNFDDDSGHRINTVLHHQVRLVVDVNDLRKKASADGYETENSGLRVQEAVSSE